MKKWGLADSAACGGGVRDQNWGGREGGTGVGTDGREGGREGGRDM